MNSLPTLTQRTKEAHAYLDESQQRASKKEALLAEQEQLLSKGDINNPSDAAKLSRTLMVLQIIERDRKNFEAAEPELKRDIPRLMANVRREFNALVSAYREKRLQALQEALRPFYGQNNERRLKKDAESLHPPEMHALSKLFAYEGYRPDATLADLIGDAQLMIAHARRVAKQIS